MSSVLTAEEGLSQLATKSGSPEVVDLQDVMLDENVLAVRNATRYQGNLDSSIWGKCLGPYCADRSSPPRRHDPNVLHEGELPGQRLAPFESFLISTRTQTGEIGRRMFEGTFASEKIFYSYIPEHVPKPHAWGHYKSEPTTWFYLADFHNLMDNVPEVRDFVSIIAKVHKESMGREDRYGFDVPTHLAHLPNDNTWQRSWETFFKQLMVKMFRFEEDAHGKDAEMETLKEDLLNKVIPRLLRPLETGGRSMKPCLIHSDLWPGNAIPDADTNEIIIFDSCAFWGHNEADLGSWRAPRYKMGAPYLKEYQRIMGMSEPHGDWDDRNSLYAIRYDLLLSALYPNSAHGLRFRHMAMDEIRRLVAKHPEGLDGFEDE